mmetsp:Transcript_716/g.1912  ORF Transcript_716/g.1912 Transcript_716/m.1912 type:complete len:225 (-) Transcript_716:3-677(-)
MADSMLPKKSRAPAKKKLPTDPLPKQKLRFSLRTQLKKWPRKRRMICLYSREMWFHSVCEPSTIWNHSWRAEFSSLPHRRCPSSALTALSSSVASAERRRQRERTSPTAGPPKTRTISAVDPPSSDTGSTYDTRAVCVRSVAAASLKAVPPDTISRLSLVAAIAGHRRCRRTNCGAELAAVGHRWPRSLATRGRSPSSPPGAGRSCSAPRKASPPRSCASRAGR